MLGQKQIVWKIGDNNWQSKRVQAGTELGKVEVLFNKLEKSIVEEERAKLGEKS